MLQLDPFRKNLPKCTEMYSYSFFSASIEQSPLVFEVEVLYMALGYHQYKAIWDTQVDE